MKLRERQSLFVERTLNALAEHGNALGVAPTGAGKTIIKAEIVGDLLARGVVEKALVLQHRDELVSQNAEKFLKYNDSQGLEERQFTATYLTGSRIKSARGDAVFGMTQTLGREKNMRYLVPQIGLLSIDEAHHTPTASNMRIINTLRELNPNLMILGLTATPLRGDKVGYEGIFNNISDQISIGELIRDGLLVPPKTFVIDTGRGEELSSVGRTRGGDYDMDEVANILNTSVVNDEVLRHWREKCADKLGGRKTIAFCSNVQHARDVADAFNAAGIAADWIDGSDSTRRKRVLKAFERGDIKIMTNVHILTEGFDDQTVEAVLLLRQSSFRGTYQQMVGRGLRIVDPEIHPGFEKWDCMVLDFGTSTLTHQSLEAVASVETQKREGGGEAPTKACPNEECGMIVPASVMECPSCGHNWERKAKKEIDYVDLTEFDILGQSRFQWVDLFGDGSATMAAAGRSGNWAGLFLDPWGSGEWHAIASVKGGKAWLLASGERNIALGHADTFLAKKTDDDSGDKGRFWMRSRPSQKALDFYYQLGGLREDLPANTTAYDLSVLIAFHKQKKRIWKLFEEANEKAA